MAQETTVWLGCGNQQPPFVPPQLGPGPRSHLCSPCGWSPEHWGGEGRRGGGGGRRREEGAADNRANCAAPHPMGTHPEAGRLHWLTPLPQVSSAAHPDPRPRKGKSLCQAGPARSGLGWGVRGGGRWGKEPWTDKLCPGQMCWGGSSDSECCPTPAAPTREAGSWPRLWWLSPTDGELGPPTESWGPCLKWKDPSSLLPPTDITHPLHPPHHPGLLALKLRTPLGVADYPRLEGAGGSQPACLTPVSPRPSWGQQEG